METFYRFNCLHSFRSKTKLETHENVCNSHDCCYVETPKKGKIILKYIHGEKPMKVPFFIYTDRESLLEKNECI